MNSAPHHPLQPTVDLVRATIRAAAPGIAEGVKWNGPSFFVKSSRLFFATVNVHRNAKQPEHVLVVLHQGVKVTRASTEGIAIRDPEGLLEWPAKDRAVVRFADLADAKAKRAAFAAVVREWVGRLGSRGAVRDGDGDDASGGTRAGAITSPRRTPRGGGSEGRARPRP